MKILVIALLLLSSSAFAQQGKVAVIPLDQTEGSLAAASRMAEMLAAGGRDVVYGEPVYEMVLRHRVVTEPEVAQDFIGVSERIAQGGNDFFYKGETQALEVLSPIIELGVTNFSYIATRPDLVPQFYEAGLIVLRAYQGLKRPEDVRATANLLARLFPALSPSLKTAPPDVLELMRKSKASVIEMTGAKVGIRIEGEANCTRYLNGTAIQDGSYPVAADTPVFIFAECEGRRSDVWELRVQAGRNVVVPLVPDYGNQFAMVDDSFQSRRDAEVVMQSIAFWGGFEEVVGLRQPATQNTAPTLFGHQRDGHVTWTETRDVPAFVGYVETTFDVQVASTKTPESTPPDWAAWSLVGGGLITTGAGVALVVLANKKAQDIVCSGSATIKPSADDCDSTFAPLTEAEFNHQRDTANAMRIGGFSAIGAGAALLTWGLWRFLDEDATDHVKPSGGGFTWVF